MKQGYDIKKMVLMAVMAAAAFMMVALIRIPVVLFLNYEPKDVIITIGGFLLGPLASFIVALLVALVEMVSISTTGPIGCLMNLLSTSCFACTAAIIYKKRRSLRGAVAGLIFGSMVMVVIMLLWNWLITPIYMGYPREAVEEMLLPVFLPFNALKAGLNSALTLLLYKPLVSALRKANLLPRRATEGKSTKWSIYLLGGILLVTCTLLLLVMQGII